MVTISNLVLHASTTGERMVSGDSLVAGLGWRLNVTLDATDRRFKYAYTNPQSLSLTLSQFFRVVAWEDIVSDVERRLMPVCDDSDVVLALCSLWYGAGDVVPLLKVQEVLRRPETRN